MNRMFKLFAFLFAWAPLMHATAMEQDLACFGNGPSRRCDLTWRLTELSGQVIPDTGASSAMTVRFSEGRVEGFSGCNRFVGAYSVKEGTLALGQMAVNLMACSGPTMALEQLFLKEFSGAMRITMKGDQLLLTPESGQGMLQFERVPPPRLDGITWEVTGYNNGRHAVVSPKSGTRLTLEFTGDRVSGSSGCNRFQGLFKTQGETMSIGPLTTTRIACDADVMAQEHAFIAALETVATWHIERGILDAHRADGERVFWAHMPE